MKIRTGNIFESLDEVYDYYNGDIVKIVNLQQFLFYAGACGIQADWVDRSPYDGKLIAYMVEFVQRIVGRSGRQLLQM